MGGKMGKENLLREMKEESEMQIMQDIYNSITSKCFNKCVSKPGDRLDKDQQVCLAKCVDRLLESRNVVTETMIERGGGSKK
mmetsp:Transcript_5840/g.20615  ORF Transcript_5840/g.20615 Transcript_5840/m.20615 type:complete len:82 (-) Transcript_5840:2005-2250(-)